MTRTGPDFRLADSDYKAGRFTSALRRLTAAGTLTLEESALAMECCEMCGLWEEAKKRADELSRVNSSHVRARAKAVLGILFGLASEIDAAEERLNEARKQLRDAGDLDRACETGIRQLAAVLDMRRGAAVDDLAAELQREVARTGNRRLMCMFHVAATNFHGSAGRLDLARTHSVLAHSHLKAEPNCWLDASLALAESGISFMLGDLQEAVRLAKNAYKAAETSGHMWCRAASATTCAFLSIRIGHVDEAAGWIDTADRLTATIPILRLANLDNVAQLALLDHHSERARRVLSLMDDPATLRGLGESWYGLPTTHTRIRLNRFLKNWETVDRLALEAIQIAETRSDPDSLALFASSRAEALAALGRPPEAIAAIGIALRELSRATPATLSEVDRSLGVLFEHFGLISAARRCVTRSSQVADHIHDAVLADEARQTEVELKKDAEGSLSEAINTIVRLWQFATANKQPEQMLANLLTAEEFEPVVKRVELTARGAGSDWQPKDRHIVTFQQPDARRESAQVLAIISHPDDLSRLGTLVLAAAAENLLLRPRRTVLARATITPTTVPQIEGDILVAPSMLQLLETANRIAATSITVLVTGETGTGKEVFARFVHKASDRKAGPFVAVNCSALPRELLESTLFGHRRGAFTGASESFDGLVKGAEGGTLFLDEVGDLPLDLQPKFLRFLETGEVLPLGTNQPTKVNVRVLAATNANLSELVASGRFRADLYYRLNGIHFQLPPLRSRREEIPALARHLLERYAEEFGKGDLTLTPEAMELLLIYDWPGNVRQLASELRRVAALAEPNGAIEPALLSPAILAGPPREAVPAHGEPTVTIPIDQDLGRALETVERTMIVRALDRSRGRVDDAARLLGISRKGLFLKRRRYGIVARES